MGRVKGDGRGGWYWDPTDEGPDQSQGVWTPGSVQAPRSAARLVPTPVAAPPVAAGSSDWFADHAPTTMPADAVLRRAWNQIQTGYEQLLGRRASDEELQAQTAAWPRDAQGYANPSPEDIQVIITSLASSPEARRYQAQGSPPYQPPTSATAPPPPGIGQSATGRPSAATAPAGFDAVKWANPEYTTPKYAVSRIISKYGSTAEGLRAALPEIQQQFPQARIVGQDTLDFGDTEYRGQRLGRVDVIQDVGGKNLPAWFPSETGPAGPGPGDVVMDRPVGGSASTLGNLAAGGQTNGETGTDGPRAPAWQIGGGDTEGAWIAPWQGTFSAPEYVSPFVAPVDRRQAVAAFAAPATRAPNYAPFAPPAARAPDVAPFVPPTDRRRAVPDFAPSAARAPGYAPYAPVTLAELNADPSYQFRQGEQQRAIERSAAARGTLLTPRTLQELSRYGSDLASTEYGAADARKFRNWSTEYGRLSNEDQSTYARELQQWTTGYNRLAGEDDDAYARRFAEWQANLGRVTSEDQTAFNRARDIWTTGYNRAVGEDETADTRAYRDWTTNYNRVGTEDEAAFARADRSAQIAKDAWATNYQKRRGEFDLARNIFETNNQNAFDRTYRLAELGRF